MKSHYGFKTDAELSNFLGVAQNTIATWRRRGKSNLDLIIAKCDDVDLNWLLKGEICRNESYVQEPTSEYVSDRREKEVTELIEKVNQGSWSADTKIALINQIIEAAQEPTKPNHNKPK